MDIIGHYKEFWSESAGTPEGPVSHFFSNTPEEDASEIGHYLRSGHEIISMMGTEPDIIGGNARIVGGASILSDGTSIWREDLAHYFETYNLRLPAKFLTQIRKTHYNMPEMTQELGMKVTKEVHVILRARKG
jgi:hypothetical protein